MSLTPRAPRTTPNLQLPVPGDNSAADYVAATGAIADRMDIVAGAVQRVTAFPPSPYDGQEVNYQANYTMAGWTDQSGQMTTDGVMWRCRYRAGSTSDYKWEVLGGSGPMHSTMSTEASPRTWELKDPVGPGVYLPRAGIYLARFYAAVRITNLGVFRSELQLSGGASAGAPFPDVGIEGVDSLPGRVMSFVAGGERVVEVPPSSYLYLLARGGTTVGTGVVLRHRSLTATPIALLG